MRLSLITLAFATSAFAQTPNFDVLSSPTEQTTYSVGSTLPIVWAPGSSTGTITLTLIGGPAANALSTVVVIAAGVESQVGAYTWTIPASVGSFASYGLNLTSDADPSTFQYSYAFHIANSATTTVISTPSSIVASATASATSTPSYIFSSYSGTPSISVAGSTSIPAAVTTTAISTFTTATAAPTTTAAGVFPSNSTTSSNTTATSSKLSEPTTAGAANLKVTGALAAIAGLMFAMAL